MAIQVNLFFINELAIRPIWTGVISSYIHSNSSASAVLSPPPMHSVAMPR